MENSRLSSAGRVIPLHPERGGRQAPASQAMGESQLTVLAGFSSLCGRRDENQDFAAFNTPDGRTLALQGVLAAVADGVSGAKGGRVAAETCVRAFLEGYYDFPATLGVAQAASRCLAAVNAWIHSQGRKDPQLAGMATTFSALILRHRQAHWIHVGDTRIYRLRGDVLEQLTTDHTHHNPNLNHVLCRAVGIEDRLCSDAGSQALEPHDRFLLCSDGLHASLPEEDMRALLMERRSPESSAGALTDRALRRGSQDNITALVVDVIAVPPPERSLLEQSVLALPVKELPRAEQCVDGFRLERVLSSGRYGSLFVARDDLDGRQVVIKFPHPQSANHAECREAFIREAWIGARVRSPWLGEAVELPPGRQSRLYTVMPYYEGRTLEQRLKDGPVSLAEGIAVALRLCKAVHALHRLNVVHRDIKPDNVQLTADGGLRLLDLGAARVPAWEEGDFPTPGTASYMAPEQFHGEAGSVATDVFAIGVTLYRMFAGGAYPFGEIEPFSTPRYRHGPKPLAQYRPDLPGWLSVVVERALSVRPEGRHADAMELAYELENGMAQASPQVRRRLSWHERDPLRFWKTTALLLLVALLASLAGLAG